MSHGSQGLLAVVVALIEVSHAESDDDAAADHRSQRRHRPLAERIRKIGEKPDEDAYRQYLAAQHERGSDFQQKKIF